MRYEATAPCWPMYTWAHLRPIAGFSHPSLPQESIQDLCRRFHGT